MDRAWRLTENVKFGSKRHKWRELWPVGEGFAAFQQSFVVLLTVGRYFFATSQLTDEA